MRYRPRRPVGGVVVGFLEGLYAEGGAVHFEHPVRCGLGESPIAAVPASTAYDSTTSGRVLRVSALAGGRCTVA